MPDVRDSDAVDHDLYDERAELHFLAALVDELMRVLHAKGTLSRDELQRIENDAMARAGGTPRAW